MNHFKPTGPVEVKILPTDDLRPFDDHSKASLPIYNPPLCGVRGRGSFPNNQVDSNGFRRIYGFARGELTIFAAASNVGKFSYSGSRAPSPKDSQ